LVEHAEQVVAQQQLTATGRAGADAEGKDLHGIVDGLGDGRGHGLALEAAGTGLYGEAVLDNAHGFLRAPALQLEAAIMVHEMWAHADVAHHRHAGIGDRLDNGGLLAPALHFNDVRTAFLHQAQSIQNADRFRGIAAVGQGDQHHAIGGAAAYRLRGLDHHVDGYRQCIEMTVVGHAERVADGGNVDARPLHPYRAGVVGHGDHHVLFPGFFCAP
jgi:hypothetical protein